MKKMELKMKNEKEKRIDKCAIILYGCINWQARPSTHFCIVFIAFDLLTLFVQNKKASTTVSSSLMFNAKQINQLFT